MMTRFRNFSFLSALILLAASFVSAQNPDKKLTFAKLNSTQIHYESHGKGKEALVLVHGWGCNLNHWRDQIPELSKRNRVIALDLPGHGLSDKPETNYDMDLFAAAIEAVMKDAGVERAVLVGHSETVLSQVSAKDARDRDRGWWLEAVRD
jgi:alpha-beta hydrolase superfamily lysophospholipase